MKTFQEYLKEAGFREGSDAIIFKGKEIDTDTIEYDMQDYSDMIFVIDIGVKYTDGTEVEDGDMDELQELPEIVDWVSDDYNDRMADKADAYRDAVKHGDFESTNEDTNNELLGDLESGLENAKAGNDMSDFIADEIGDYIRAGIEDMGEEAWQDSIEGKALAELDPVDSPEEQAKAFQNAINVLKGGNESTNEDRGRGIGTLDKFRELYRKGIGSNDDEVVLKELIEVINDDALFADEFPALKAFTNPSEFDDSEIVTAQNVPGDSADEKIMSLIKAIGDDSWVDDFAQQLMKDFNMGENVELDRIKELAGASIDETYDDDDDFYEAYGEMWYNEDEIMDEAEYQGRKVKLGKPMQGDVKKFKVYVKDPKTGNVKKVNFGHGGSSVKGKAMSIKKSNPARRKSFRARHNCDNPGPRTKARYWSCRKW
jgi:hypothetical protein